VAIACWSPRSRWNNRASRRGRRHAGTAAPASLIGRKVSHYRVLEVIGGGVWAWCIRPKNLKLGRRVALKFLPERVANDPISLRRFEREARTASALNHPNICTITKLKNNEGRPSLSWSCWKAVASFRAGPFEPDAVRLQALLDIAIQSAAALQASRQGIIHRDIKPATFS